MKKGAKIEVTNSARYTGQDMQWTERCTGIKKIGKGGEWVIHTSDRFISAFLSKCICVHPAEHSENFFVSSATKKEISGIYNWKKYVYAIFLPEGFEVETFSNDEYRFFLSVNMTVIFCGTVIEAKKGVEARMTNHGVMNVSTYIQYSDTILPKTAMEEK